MPFYLECVWVILVVVPPVSSYEILVSMKQSSLAGWIVEVKLLEIVNENIFAIISYFLNCSTSIHHWSHRKNLRSCMSNYFSPRTSSSPSTTTWSIMVALDPKLKETLTVDHGSIDGLILVECFHVFKKRVHLVARASCTQVDNIGRHYDCWNCPGLQEVV